MRVRYTLCSHWLTRTNMKDRMETEFNTRSVQVSEVPPRSRLYSQKPIGVGTSWVESLTSYTNRLALAYCVDPRALIFQEIVPLLDHTYYMQMSYKNFANFARKEVMSINGTGKIAADWSQTLERLTARTDIRSLTTQSWASGLPIQGLLRETPAWCPTCYHEWREQGLPLYQPLLCMIRSVTICLRHQRRLEELCSQCQKHQLVISTSGQLGYCTQCTVWLGTSVTLEHDIAEETFDWQRWVVNEVDELYQTMASSGPLPWAKLRLNLATCVEAVGSARKLAHLTKFSRPQIMRWVQGSKNPSFESLLRLCYVLDLSLVKLITNDQMVLKEALQGGKIHSLSRPAYPAYLPVNREIILAVIQSALANEGVPLSVAHIARNVKISPRTLRTLFPQECILISARYRIYRAQEKKQRVAQFCDEIRQAVLVLHAQGIYPSQHRVESMLSQSLVMRKPESKATWRAVCRELEIVSS